MQRDQTVLEMVEEVLERQAKALADNTGQPFESALEIVARTEAGRQLRELRDGPNRHEKARDWQADLAWGRAEELLMTSWLLVPRRIVATRGWRTISCGWRARRRAKNYAALEWLHA